jgi:hypothetical protein
MIPIMLKKSLAILFLSSTISFLIINSSYQNWKSSHYNINTVKKNIAFLQQKYNSSIHHQKQFYLYRNKYLSLEKNGVVGKANRINWINTLESIIDNHKISYIKFKLGKTLPFISDSFSHIYPDIDLYTTNMTLNLQLLHEADLFSILDSLKNNAKGLFDIKNCTIIRNPSTSTPLLSRVSDKNFSAFCSLNWYTIIKSTASISKT